MAAVDDRVHIPSRKIGEAPREGVVTGLTGSLLRVRWSTGEESTIMSSMGSIEVIGKTRSPTAKKAAKVAAKPTKPSKVPAAKAKPTAKKAAKAAPKPTKSNKLPAVEATPTAKQRSK